MGRVIINQKISSIALRSTKLIIGNEFQKIFVPPSTILSSMVVASFALNFLATRRSIARGNFFVNGQSVAFRNEFGIVWRLFILVKVFGVCYNAYNFFGEVL